MGGHGPGHVGWGHGCLPAEFSGGLGRIGPADGNVGRPEKFGINPRRENAKPGVTPPTGSREAGATERSFSSLSAETQAIYHRAAKIAERAGAKLSKADWLKEIGM